MGAKFKARQAQLIAELDRLLQPFLSLPPEGGGKDEETKQTVARLYANIPVFARAVGAFIYGENYRKFGEQPYSTLGSQISSALHTLKRMARRIPKGPGNHLPPKKSLTDLRDDIARALLAVPPRPD